MNQPVTAERIDPLLATPDSAYDQQSLALHLERYRFAQAYVRDRHVVDCACGTGYGTAMLAEAGARSAVGVDIAEEAIRFAQSHYARPRARYVVGDAYAFEPPDRPDVWVTLETVEHLPDPGRYLRAVYARLAPSGTLIASVPTTVSTDGNPYHLQDFSRASWRRLVRDSGFGIGEELVQTHRYALREIFGAERGPRQEVRRGLFGYYATHPGVAWRRLALTLTRGFVNEYLVVVARRRD